MQDPQTQRTRVRWNSPIIKVMAVLLCISCFFVHPVFATETTTTPLDSLRSNLNSLLSVLSRLWIVLATIAGKLMTNSWVFGAPIGRDIYLWKIWNITKNFANFALVGIVLWTVIKGLIGKDGVKPMDIIKKTLIAAVLIQASRFIMGALVDISNVAVTAIAAFPASFIQNNPERENTIAGDVRTKMIGAKVMVDMTAPSNSVQIQNNTQNMTTTTNDQALAAILPDANSISGPLVYLGMSVFRFQEYLVQTTTPADIKWQTINFSLKVVILVFYTVMMALICVANRLRINFLQLFIIIGPFVVLANVFSLSVGGDGDKWMGKWLKMSTFMDMLLKPVVFVAALSMILIFIVSIQNIMTWGNLPALNGVKIDTQSWSSSLAVQWVSTVEVNGNMFSDLGNTSKNAFADIIVFLLAAFLTWELVKISLTSWPDSPIKSVMWKATEGLEKWFLTRPLIWWLSVSAATGAAKGTVRRVEETVRMNAEGTFYKADENYRHKLESLMGMHQSRGSDDYKILNDTARAGGDFFAKAKELWADKSGISFSDSEIKSAFNLRLDKKQKDGPLSKITFGGLHLQGTYDPAKPDDLFNGTTTAAEQNRWIIHNLMWGDLHDNQVNERSSTNPPDFTTLTSNIYYKPELKS